MEDNPGSLFNCKSHLSLLNDTALHKPPLQASSRLIYTKNTDIANCYYCINFVGDLTKLYTISLHKVTVNSDVSNHIIFQIFSSLGSFFQSFKVRNLQSRGWNLLLSQRILSDCHWTRKRNQPFVASLTTRLSNLWLLWKGNVFNSKIFDLHNFKTSASCLFGFCVH